MKPFILVLGVLSSSFASAAVVVTTWTNPKCQTGPCEVKAVRMYINKVNNGRLAGNQMGAEIETTSRSALNKYAFVQYIKGCVYKTTAAGETKIGTREFFMTPGVPFLHKEFELDSASDRDPIYWSNPRAGFDELRGIHIPRHSGYATRNPVTVDDPTAWAGKPSNLVENKLFVSDFPTPSAYELNNQNQIDARNSSLEFKICLHEISKIPAVVDAAATTIPDPIVCMEWSSNYQYSYQRKVFVELKEISPVCR